MEKNEEFEVRADFAKLILRATQKESWELTKICEALNESLEALEGQ